MANEEIIRGLLEKLDRVMRERDIAIDRVAELEIRIVELESIIVRLEKGAL